MQQFTHNLLIAIFLAGVSGTVPAATTAQERDERAGSDEERAEFNRRKAEEKIAAAREKMLQREIGMHEKRVAELKTALGQLKDGQDKEAAQIKKQLDQIVAEMSKLRAQLKGDRGDRERREVVDKRLNREQIVARLEKLGDVIAALAKEGRHDAAEKMEHQARELKAMLEKMSAQPREEGSKGRRAESTHEGDAAKRAHHLFAAAKNLRQAGMTDLAEKLQREAQQLVAQDEAGKRRVDVEVEFAPTRDKREKPEGVLAELVGELRALRREVDELRGQMKRLQGERGERRL